MLSPTTAREKRTVLTTLTHLLASTRLPSLSSIREQPIIKPHSRCAISSLAPWSPSFRCPSWPDVVEKPSRTRCSLQGSIDRKPPRTKTRLRSPITQTTRWFVPTRSSKLTLRSSTGTRVTLAGAHTESASAYMERLATTRKKRSSGTTLPSEVRSRRRSGQGCSALSQLPLSAREIEQWRFEHSFGHETNRASETRLSTKASSEQKMQCVGAISFLIRTSS